MARLACVEVRALPLQVLLRAHPAWADGPVAVVEADLPQATVTHVNDSARRLGVVPGLSYSAALSLSAHLRAGVVERTQLRGAAEGLLTLLRDWSPAIEPSRDDASVFWCDVAGLGALFPSLSRWVAQVRAALQAAGWRAVVCGGFTRFGSYAVARALPLDTARALASREEEHALMLQTRLSRLGLEADALQSLEKLGVDTVRGLTSLPLSGVRRRFGAAAERLVLQASGRRPEPFQPLPPEVPFEARLDFDEPARDVSQLLFACLPALRALLRSLWARQLALRALQLTLWRDGLREQSLAPLVVPVAFAEPTCDEGRVAEQLRLTLARVLSAVRPGEVSLGVKAVLLEAAGAPATAAQLALVDRPRRDPAATRRALERLRATFGEDAVLTLAQGPGHLPEARLRLTPLSDVPPLPSPTGGEGVLIRRVRFKAEPLPPRPTRAADGWLVKGAAGGPVVREHGPFHLDGGWWQGEVRRQYVFLELAGGALLWCYYDALRAQWRLHGSVE